MAKHEILILTLGSIVVVGIAIAVFYKPDSKAESKSETTQEGLISTIIDFFGKPDPEEPLEPEITPTEAVGETEVTPTTV
jgi:hypothetical protein